MSSTGLQIVTPKASIISFPETTGILALKNEIPDEYYYNNFITLNIPTSESMKSKYGCEFVFTYTNIEDSNTLISTYYIQSQSNLTFQVITEDNIDIGNTLEDLLNNIRNSYNNKAQGDGDIAYIPISGCLRVSNDRDAESLDSTVLINLYALGVCENDNTIDSYYMKLYGVTTNENKNWEVVLTLDIDQQSDIYHLPLDGTYLLCISSLLSYGFCSFN